MQQKNYERKRGGWIVQNAIADLEKKYIDIRKDISTARDFGDLSENFEYHAAKAEQGKIATDLMELKEYKSNMEIVDIKNINHDRVSVCATVYLINIENEDKRNYTIVGKYEVDADKYLISYLSPIGRALLGKQIDEVVELPNPNSTEPLYYKVIKINYEEYSEDLESVGAVKKKD
jgi:transcription elongation factor GreA